jgi:predicted dinucleotide-binding enzyme
LTIAIIGVGNIGSTVARELVAGGERVVVAARDQSHAEALADELGPLATAASVDEAITEGDVVLLALWLDQTKELISQHTRQLEDKIVIDPSNPVSYDETGQPSRTLPDGQSAGSIVASLLPASTHFVKAFGTLSSVSLGESPNREPRRATLFYATDDEPAARTVERLIRAAGFDPLKVGGLADAGRIESPDGPLSQGALNGELLDLDQAREAVATTEVPA